MPIRCLEDYASKPDSLKVTVLGSMMVNSTMTDLVQEPLTIPTLWYRLICRKGVETFIMLNMTEHMSL